jgi:hypothetical protein
MSRFAKRRSFSIHPLAAHLGSSILAVLLAVGSLCSGRAAFCVEPTDARPAAVPVGFRPLFDGETLRGWHSAQRIGVSAKPIQPPAVSSSASNTSPAKLPQSKLPISQALQASKPRWEVRDHMIVGAQDEARIKKPETGEDWGFGSWLMTDETFGDFELLVNAKPDWPCDTGIYVRSTALGQGFQVLLDHRGDDKLGVGGSVGFLYLRGIGGFRVCPYNFRWQTGADVLPTDVNLMPSNRPEISPEFSATNEEFRRAWKMNDWNTFRIRVVGQLPRITTWINDVKICECDTAAIQHPDYDPAAVSALLGPRGHIAFEVHDGPPERWGLGRVTRWRDIYIREL